MKSLLSGNDLPDATVDSEEVMIGAAVEGGRVGGGTSGIF